MDAQTPFMFKGGEGVNAGQGEVDDGRAEPGLVRFGADPAAVKHCVEPREQPRELLDGERARLAAQVRARQGQRAPGAEAAHLADEGVVRDPGLLFGIVVRFTALTRVS